MRKELLSLAGGLLSAAASGRGEKKGSLEHRIIEVGDKKFDYQIHVPAQIEKEQALPVIVFLHGIGQRGAGGFVPAEGAGGAIARHYLGQVPAVILLPQCRLGSYWSDAVMEEMVMKEIEKTVEEFGADANRIYLTGVSMGGYGVWHFAAQFPARFAALVSICGGSSITTGDRFAPLAEKVGKTPAWLFHGVDDKVVAVAESRHIVAALKGGGNVKYNEYPNAGHNVWMNALGEKDLMSWLLAHKRD